MSKTITSPKGVLGPYPHLATPDTKFDEAGVYQCKQVVSIDEAMPLVEKLEEAYEEAYEAELVKQKKKKLKQADMPWEVNEEEGTVTFSYKLKATITSKKRGVMTRRVKLFDSKGKLLKDAANLRIGGGSTVKLAFQPYFWFSPSVGFGLQLQLEACQIITLVEFGNDRDFGFGEEDGGFDADDADNFGDESGAEDGADEDDGNDDF